MNSVYGLFTGVSTLLAILLGVCVMYYLSTHAPLDEASQPRQIAAARRAVRIVHWIALGIALAPFHVIGPYEIRISIVCFTIWVMTGIEVWDFINLRRHGVVARIQKGKS